MTHKDAVNGFEKWEDMFADRLETHFGILPDSSIRFRERSTITPKSSTQSSSVPEFSRTAFHAFANLYSLKVDDLSYKNGNLWVRIGDTNVQVTKVLKDWGFRYKPGKGWWR
jgi:N6-adenosine-specific RNA methylase IME4